MTTQEGRIAQDALAIRIDDLAQRRLEGPDRFRGDRAQERAHSRSRGGGLLTPGAGHRRSMDQGVGALGQLLDVHPAGEQMGQQLPGLVLRTGVDRLHRERDLVQGFGQANLLGESPIGDEQAVLSLDDGLIPIGFTHLRHPFWLLIGILSPLSLRDWMLALAHLDGARTIRPPFARNLGQLGTYCLSGLRTVTLTARK